QLFVAAGAVRANTSEEYDPRVRRKQDAACDLWFAPASEMRRLFVAAGAVRANTSDAIRSSRVNSVAGRMVNSVAGSGFMVCRNVVLRGLLRVVGGCGRTTAAVSLRRTLRFISRRNHQHIAGFERGRQR